jgi:hypothetical protein
VLMGQRTAPGILVHVSGVGSWMVLERLCTLALQDASWRR